MKREAYGPKEIRRRTRTYTWASRSDKFRIEGQIRGHEFDEHILRHLGMKY